ncbi:hypothetical protein J6590_060465 [Homalodisca vitripennis]|nr:hypothetical protein J6590_060465 [Homalodisca vitripennis]
MQLSEFEDNKRRQSSPILNLVSKFSISVQFFFKCQVMFAFKIPHYLYYHSAGFETE